MANVDAAFGFVPVRHMSGNIPRANKYTCASGLAENIFTGDLCIIINTGLITPQEHLLRLTSVIVLMLLLELVLL